MTTGDSFNRSQIDSIVAQAVGQIGQHLLSRLQEELSKYIEVMVMENDSVQKISRGDGEELQALVRISMSPEMETVLQLIGGVDLDYGPVALASMSEAVPEGLDLVAALGRLESHGLVIHLRPSYGLPSRYVLTTVGRDIYRQIKPLLG